MIPRLRAQLWVDAQSRRCSGMAIPFYVVRRGDADAGMVLIKLIREAGRAEVLTPERRDDDSLAWVALVAIATVMAVGLSWSHVRRRVSGQLDVDDVEE